ncbi:MAG: ATP-dependent helicase C-terminal domain-containing protein, partial [Bacteriovoracia bacterium]
DNLERYFSRFGAGEVQTQSVPGTRHPIEPRYGAKTPSWQELPGAVHRALQSTEGDALIFLPGMAEIRRVEGLLRERGLDPVILHGDLDRREQERALEPSSRRKIILSTNIAESSVTLPGIRVVVDSGLARVARASQAAGFTRLETKRISRASADQRAGRAGRLGPGVCVRLYTEHEYRALRQFEAPEVRRVDLVPAALQLALIGVRKLEDFEWVEAPSADAWRGAGDWLRGIEALKSDGELTTRGRRLAGTPLHPRLALLLEGPREFTRLAARFSEGDFPEGELALDALVNTPTQGNTRRLEERLQASPRPEETGKLSPTSVLVRAFWDRVGRVRGDRVALAGGGELALHREHKLAPRQLLLLLDALERDTGPAVLRSWISLQEEDLWEFAGTLLEDSRTVQWNGEKQRAEVWAELRFGSLALESRMDVPKEEDATALEAVLLKELLKRPEQAVSMDKLRALWARKGFARTGEPPGPLEGAALEGWLRELAVGARSFAEIHDAVEAVTLSPEEASLAPEFVTLPGRAKCPVQYETDRPPWIESRLQDFFGLKEGPRVFRGKVPLTLHLLAPNYRPVQVTRDLSGFWERDYPRVRQELSRRYPRHKWPERPI